jgi:tetratricopeptide (TPR) repeat protein
MIDQVADAFERQDYRTAARLLKQLVAQEPKNPWVQLYVARLQEVKGKLETAETIYRKLLKKTTNSKIMSQARQGLGRLETLEKERRQKALAEATTNPNSAELGILIIEPLTPEAKTDIVPKFARIMQLDLYTARLQLPTRGWRLYRTGPVGQLNFYVSSLREVSIPCFSATLAALKKINVFNIHYFSDDNPTAQATVVCQDAQGQLGSLTFNWSEITQRVEGLLPIFEEVVDLDARRKLQRKTQTSDYARFCDLHLPGRNTILRLCDRNYQFQKGLRLTAQSLQDGIRNSQTSVQEQGTTRKNWENLLDFLNPKLSNTPVWADFKKFAETAMDFREMLSHLPSHIDLFRRDETFWDSAFQLYSGLVFLKSSANTASIFEEEIRK